MCLLADNRPDGRLESTIREGEMSGIFTRWREARRIARTQRGFDDAFNEIFGEGDRVNPRTLKDRELHARLARPDLGPVARGMASQELRRREAWAAPAGRAYWISATALVVSIAALGLSVFA